MNCQTNYPLQRFQRTKPLEADLISFVVYSAVAVFKHDTIKSISNAAIFGKFLTLIGLG